MSINLTDELLAKTKKGKIASAKQVFLDGDQENLQQIGDKTHQLENAIKDITVSGGASTANAVSYSNETSGMTAVTAQGAIDELAAKNKTQDATIGTKAEKADVQASVSELKAKNTSQDAVIEKKANSADVNTELDKKFNKENIAQELGESKDKVVSQFALPFREIESPEFIKAIVDAEYHFLLGIQLDGSIEWGKGIPAPIRAKLQEIINQCQQDKTDILETIKVAKEELTASLQTYQQTTDASITSLQEGKVDKEEGKSLIEDEVKGCFRIIENEEFLWAVVDSEDRVLLGIYRATGKPYYPLNEMYHVIQNEEYFAAWVTTDDKVVLGIRRDGKIIGNVYGLEKIKLDISHLQENLTDLDDTVNSIKNNLIDTDKVKEIVNESISEQYPKNKWLPILSNLKRVKTDVSTGLQVTDEATLSLLWLSDVHKRFEAMQHFLYFKEKYKKYIDDAILSGDVVNLRWQDDISNLTSINGYNDMLFAIGNHDVSGYNADEPWTVGPNVPLTEAYKRYMRNWDGCIFSSDAEEKGKMYYYKDYDLQKIRLIVLDSNLSNNYFSDIKNEQDNWFETVLSDAKDRGLSVIACMHIPHGGVDSGFDCPFNSMDNEKAKAYSTGVVLNDKVQAFQRNGGDFICWMFGHLHTDFCGTLKVYPNQLFFSIGGALFNDAGNCDSSKIEGTNSEDLFNIISIDNNKKLIRLIRIGNEYDRHCRHRGGIVVDYSNKENVKLISSW